MKTLVWYLQLFILAAFSSVLVGKVHADAPAKAGDPAKATYLRYCSACHGESGKGDGVVSGLMKPPPTDLTTLAKRSNGAFPYARVMGTIDGRESIRAHGDPNMPVWGDIFKLEDGMTMATQAEVRGKVMLITEHLVKIQEK